VDGRHEPVVAGADETALGLGEARLVLAAAGGGGEGRADIRHLLDALPDRGEIGIRLVAAGRIQIE
jgi:hypothetical protein